MEGGEEWKRVAGLSTEACIQSWPSREGLTAFVGRYCCCEQSECSWGNKVKYLKGKV